MKINAFTKTELIVIIVLTIITLLIGTPIVSNAMKNARKSAFMSNVKMLIYQIEYKKLEEDNFNPDSLNISNLKSHGFSDEDYSSFALKTIDNEIYIKIKGKLTWNNLIACGTLKDMKVVDIKDEKSCLNP
ncbi:MAG TPA: hypothetical protein GXZ95_04430 [Mollicutes bacterium]|nr:hypothetical protein [Mollicutes bacterium]